MTDVPPRPVVIAGASGFMGAAVVAHWRAQGRPVTTVGRRAGELAWDDADGIRRALDGAALLVNFAGRSVNCRYDAVHRAEILDSRLRTTGALARAIATASAPPPVWINASSATLYGAGHAAPSTEDSPSDGTGFSVGVVRAWEQAFFEPELPGVRRAALRTTIVLGDGGALVPMLNLARWGLGGAQWDMPWPAGRARRAAGTAYRYGGFPFGRQWFSWVHLDDVVGVVDAVEADPRLSGPINLGTPHPVTNAELMRTIRRALGMPFGVPAPRPVLELGAWLIRTETELLLKSRWVHPQRLLDAGYTFRHPELEPAIRAVVDTRRRTRQGSAVV
ncbi:epimerase [Protaetiibacter larvae]|uniref:DUF1731 domain-containing protein n=1 Tax=Protaetiibacter larvae TaxID=2592654 RepID=A0A5C1Y8V8_9MICO|nr:DUF1731 domain-containing protein [Protaetiibacter larvae]QEO10090.1 DUF1731 domain-containing protein [Protaetiibacter larvae]